MEPRPASKGRGWEGEMSEGKWERKGRAVRRKVGEKPACPTNKNRSRAPGIRPTSAPCLRVFCSRVNTNRFNRSFP